jgi:hypothetical protein
MLEPQVSDVQGSVKVGEGWEVLQGQERGREMVLAREPLQRPDKEQEPPQVVGEVEQRQLVERVERAEQTQPAALVVQAEMFPLVETVAWAERTQPAEQVGTFRRVVQTQRVVLVACIPRVGPVASSQQVVPVEPFPPVDIADMADSTDMADRMMLVVRTSFLGVSTVACPAGN